MSDKKTLNIYQVLEVLNDKINTNTTSNNLLLEKLDNIDDKLSILKNMVSLGKTKNQEDLDSLKTELSDIHTTLDDEIDKIHSIHKNMNKSNLESKQELKNLISKESKNLKQKITEKADAYEEAAKQAYDALVSDFDDYSTKTDKKITDSVKSLDSKIDSKINKQNTNLDKYKVEINQSTDKINEYIISLKTSTNEKLFKLKEELINKVDVFSKNYTERLENTSKLFEINLETQSNETKTYLLEELNKINQTNLNFLSTEFFKNKEELQDFLSKEFKNTQEENNKNLDNKIKNNLDTLIKNFDQIKSDNQIFIESRIKDLVNNSFNNMRKDINDDLDNIVNRILNARIL